MSPPMRQSDGFCIRCQRTAHEGLWATVLKRTLGWLQTMALAGGPVGDQAKRFEAFKRMLEDECRENEAQLWHFYSVGQAKGFIGLSPFGEPDVVVIAGGLRPGGMSAEEAIRLGLWMKCHLADAHVVLYVNGKPRGTALFDDHLWPLNWVSDAPDYVSRALRGALRERGAEEFVLVLPTAYGGDDGEKKVVAASSPS